MKTNRDIAQAKQGPARFEPRLPRRPSKHRCVAAGPDHPRVVAQVGRLPGPELAHRADRAPEHARFDRRKRRRSPAGRRIDAARPEATGRSERAGRGRPRLSPGAIAPPCQIPCSEIRSTVMAVPHETTSPGRPRGARPMAAATASARSAPAVSGPIQRSAARQRPPPNGTRLPWRCPGRRETTEAAWPPAD